MHFELYPDCGSVCKHTKREQERGREREREDEDKRLHAFFMGLLHLLLGLHYNVAKLIGFSSPTLHSLGKNKHVPFDEAPVAILRNMSDT